MIVFASYIEFKNSESSKKQFFHIIDLLTLKDTLSTDVLLYVSKVLPLEKFCHITSLHGKYLRPMKQH